MSTYEIYNTSFDWLLYDPNPAWSSTLSCCLINDTNDLCLFHCSGVNRFLQHRLLHPFCRHCAPVLGPPWLLLLFTKEFSCFDFLHRVRPDMLPCLKYGLGYFAVEDWSISVRGCAFSWTKHLTFGLQLMRMLQWPDSVIDSHTHALICNVCVCHIYKRKYIFYDMNTYSRIFFRIAAIQKGLAEQAVKREELRKVFILQPETIKHFFLNLPIYSQCNGFFVSFLFCYTHTHIHTYTQHTQYMIQSLMHFFR